jgi:hypothetical protein
MIGSHLWYSINWGGYIIPFDRDTDNPSGIWTAGNTKPMLSKLIQTLSSTNCRQNPIWLPKEIFQIDL